jgi:hypothetical protein
MSEFHEEELYGAIARGWCDEHNSSKTVDVILADAIAIEVLALVRPLSAENERLKELLRAWCTVPWLHKTPEMLERTRAALERPA